MPHSADLGQPLEDYVSRLIQDGRFKSREEVLREGVRLLEEREKCREALDSALKRGVADAEAERVRPAGEVAARLTAKFANLADKRGS